MQNKVQEEGDVVTLTMPYDRTAGQMVKVGNLIGIVAVAALSGVDASVDTEGVFDVPDKHTTDTFSQGDPAFWDDSAKKITSTQAGNSRAGIVLEPVASGDTSVRLKLLPSGEVGGGSNQAAHVAKLGVTADLTAIAASYADEAAARASVNTLRTDVEARLDAIEAKLDAVIQAMYDASLMASS